VSALARPRQYRRRRRVLRVVATIAFVLLVFLLGIAFARTLDERPKSSGVATTERTLTPLPQSTPARTVTVTVTGP
jgi:hypothetical protein